MFRANYWDKSPSQGRLGQGPTARVQRLPPPSGFKGVIKHYLSVQVPAYALLFAYAVKAEATLSFKNDAVASIHWIPYCLVLIVLLALLWCLAKYIKPKAISKQQAKIIETIALHHKTKAYILEYQGQQFLIAEHQNAIAIQTLKQGDSVV